ncbi:HAD-IC family P-type ATPase [Vagococcus silagei]|uniref:HAD family hydrolase n=1 Tax=Vagococcus silagei TaxID=2508885 RepID=A0A4S3B4Y0_9ENTE|nr:HAD-IC family P-type ATPase [Vagococcus silagei]THB61912.1 HAD family hydrolase [Vagococcus silagei]
MENPKGYPGLSTHEVERRKARGDINVSPPSTTRSLNQIIIENSLTFFNLINLVIAGFIIYTGSYKNLLFLGVIISNTCIGVFQELRAKKNIDSLSLLNQAKTAVIRESKVVSIPQDEVVKDDLIIIKRGDQIIVDGEIIDTLGLEIDESQLTGESDAIKKTMGSRVLSGSFVISGSGVMQAKEVGVETYAFQLTKAAKEETGIYSELMMMLKKMIRILSFVIIPVGAILMITSLLRHSVIEEAILGSTAAMIGMIPEGLILLTSVALAIGVIKLSRQKVLVQTMGSIETLARVDVLCLDKTGTLTSGELKVIDLECFTEIDDAQLREWLSYAVNGLNEENATGNALTNHFKKIDHDYQIKHQIPFSSARKWSAIEFEELGSFYLGAPEYLYKDLSDAQQENLKARMEQGMRIIAFGRDSGELDPELKVPTDLELLGFIYLEDEIRAEAAHTLQYFKEQAVDICIISGDHPDTVSQIARRVGIQNSRKKIDMSQVEEHEIPAMIDEYRIFGRVSPEQKKYLVECLQEKGHVVGMTGDGVNDILALKKADCSIVMANGSDAAKGIADFVLLDSNFDSLINVVLEGRRVINNIQNVASLYLTKTIYSLCLALIFIFLATRYPFQPIQLSPINSLTVGIPSFFLALRPTLTPIRGKFLKNVIKPPLASGVTIVILTILVQWSGSLLSWSYEEKSTITVLLTGIVGFTILYEIAKPITGKIILLITCLMAAFFSLFLFFTKLFSLVSIFQWHLAIVYLPLAFLGVILFHILLKCVKQIIK